MAKLVRVKIGGICQGVTIILCHCPSKILETWLHFRGVFQLILVCLAEYGIFVRAPTETPNMSKLAIFLNLGNLKK